MNFGLSDEQTLLKEAARNALARAGSVAAAREAIEDPAQLPDLWPTAVSAGWPGLLIGEDRGGAGLGAFEAMLVAEECGRVLAGVPLVGTLPATALLDAAGDASLADVAAGTVRPALLAARPGDGGWTADPVSGRGRVPAPTATREGDDVVLDGTVGFAIDVPGADLLVVVCADGTAAAVDAQADGVEITPVRRFDATRSLAHVTLRGARGRVLDVSAEDCALAWHLGQGLLASEALGATEAMMEMAVEYAKQRFTFGRTIGSYQAIKHPLTDVLRQAENTRSLQYWAGWAWESRPEEFGLATGALRTVADRALSSTNTTNIVTFGGIGVTWEHDAPLYFRRATLSTRLLGGTHAATDAFAGELLERGGIPAHA